MKFVVWSCEISIDVLCQLTRIDACALTLWQVFSRCRSRIPSPTPSLCFMSLRGARSLVRMLAARFASRRCDALASLARWLRFASLTCSLARFARFVRSLCCAHTLTWDKCRTKILDWVGGGFRAASDSINNIIRPRVGLTAPIARL